MPPAQGPRLAACSFSKASDTGSSERRDLPAEPRVCLCGRACVCVPCLHLRPVSSLFWSAQRSDRQLAAPGPFCPRRLLLERQGESSGSGEGRERPMGASGYRFCVEMPKHTTTLYANKKESIKLLIITRSSQWEEVLTNTGSECHEPKWKSSFSVDILPSSLFLFLLLLFIYLFFNELRGRIQSSQ